MDIPQERFLGRIVEQLVDVAVPHVEVVRSIPQEVEEIGEVLVPQICVENRLLVNCILHSVFEAAAPAVLLLPFNRVHPYSCFSVLLVVFS